MPGGSLSGGSAIVTWSPSRSDRVPAGFAAKLVRASGGQDAADQPSQHIGQHADRAEMGGS